jgi:hypothetical protein
MDVAVAGSARVSVGVGSGVAVGSSVGVGDSVVIGTVVQVGKAVPVRCGVGVVSATAGVGPCAAMRKNPRA